MKKLLLNLILIVLSTKFIQAQCTVSIVSNISQGCAPLQVMFFCPSVNTGTAVWSMDNTTINGLVVQHTFFNPGTYTVNFDLIMITSPSGTCLATASIVVNVVTGPSNGCTTTVGLKKLQNKEDFALYPNPSHGGLTLQLDREIGNTELILYTTKGEKVQSQKIISETTKISIQDLAPGFYIYTLIEEGQLSVQGKLILE